MMINIKKRLMICIWKVNICTFWDGSKSSYKYVDFWGFIQPINYKRFEVQSLGITGLQYWIGATLGCYIPRNGKCFQSLLNEVHFLKIVNHCSKASYLDDIHLKSRDWNFLFNYVNSTAPWRQKCKLPLKRRRCCARC